MNTFGEEVLRGKVKLSKRKRLFKAKELRLLFLLRVVIKFFLTSRESESENKFLDLD